MRDAHTAQGKRWRASGLSGRPKRATNSRLATRICERTEYVAPPWPRARSRRREEVYYLPLETRPSLRQEKRFQIRNIDSGLDVRCSIRKHAVDEFKVTRGQVSFRPARSPRRPCLRWSGH